MEQFFESWLEHAKTLLKPRTYESYEMIVKRHFIPSFGNIPLDKFNDAVKWKKIRENPLKFVDPPKPVKKKMLVLDPNQILEFLVTVKRRKDRLYTLYITAIILGLRRSEISGLKWQDIDFERRTVQVRRQNQILRNSDSNKIFRHDLKRKNQNL